MTSAQLANFTGLNLSIKVGEQTPITSSCGGYRAPTPISDRSGLSGQTITFESVNETGYRIEAQTVALKDISSTEFNSIIIGVANPRGRVKTATVKKFSKLDTDIIYFNCISSDNTPSTTFSQINPAEDAQIRMVVVLIPTDLTADNIGRFPTIFTQAMTLARSALSIEGATSICDSPYLQGTSLCSSNNYIWIIVVLFIVLILVVVVVAIIYFAYKKHKNKNP